MERQECTSHVEICFAYVLYNIKRALFLTSACYKVLYTYIFFIYVNSGFFINEASVNFGHFSMFKMMGFGCFS
jgi:hypothetical protein